MADPSPAAPANAAGETGPRPARRRRRRALAALAPVVAVLLVFAGGFLLGQRWDARTPGAAAEPPAPTVTVTAEPEPDAAPPAPAAPTRLVIRSLGIEAPVIGVRLRSDAVLEPPPDPDVVGWWDGSAQPGATTGRVVITGHTVSNGDGALDRLPELDSGRIVLVTETGRHRYRVTDNLVASYEQVAERARDIFGQTEESPDGARLILVTCTDFNGRFYESNQIVVAEPV
ncbi:class F sortase [Nocardioides litoris]|uniref:class F sortase n=1 Tax=Nocardioides litoris TaxID=1926648 RepID=UPI00112213AB|nr:class F sortase [Nocardioides litoris]